MVSGLHFVETLLIGTGVFMLLGAFVLACMESRHGDDVDEMRGWLAAQFNTIKLTQVEKTLVLSLAWLRDAIDSVVSEFIMDFERSTFSAPIVMALLAVILPAAAVANAMLGGSPFLLNVYVGVGIVILLLAVVRMTPGMVKLLGVVSATTTIAWLIFAPFFAVHSLTDHILKGTFSHSVLASVFVAILLYAGCAGVWLIYRAYSDVSRLSPLDRALARFLFAVPLVYMLYWFGLLSGHFSTFTPSPPREWSALISVVLVGAVSFSAILTTIDAGVVESRRGHGLAVILAVLILSMVGVVANSSLVANEFPFWLRLWSAEFGPDHIVLDGRFWISHSPFFLWFLMIFVTLLVVIGKLIASSWGGVVARPFIGLSIVCTLGSVLLLGAGSLIDVYVNVN